MLELVAIIFSATLAMFKLCVRAIESLVVCWLSSALRLDAVVVSFSCAFVVSTDAVRVAVWVVAAYVLLRLPLGRCTSAAGLTRLSGFTTDEDAQCEERKNEILLRLLLAVLNAQISCDPSSNEAEVGQCALLRPGSAFDWCRMNTKGILDHHVRYRSRDSILYKPAIEDAVAVFRDMGACMRMVYMGAGMETASDVPTVQTCPRVAPSVLASAPARLRQTYWHRIPHPGTQNVLMASLTEVLLAFVDMHSCANLNDLDMWSRV